MRRWYSLVCILLLAILPGCGGSNNNVNNVGLFGDWNVVMYQANTQNPVYVFGIAMSQEGSNTYSGTSITYNGSVAVPANMCINANTLQARATTTGSSYTMTVTDTSTSTVISVTGTLPSVGTTVSGNYSNAASSACGASSGSMTMAAQ